MSKNVVKNQHTVWRKYLQPWTDDLKTTKGYLYCLDKNKNEIRKQGVEGVAVERYFYDISMLNNKDEKLFNLMFKKYFPKINVSLNKNSSYLEKDYLEKEFISKSEDIGGKYLKKLLNKENPFNDNDYDFKISFCYIYLKSLKDSNIISEEDLENNLNEMNEFIGGNEKYQFFEFVSIQMLRTQANRILIENTTNETKTIFPNGNFKGTSEASFPLMMIVNSKILTEAFFKNDFCVELIDNQTNVDFITGDNPVILYGDNKTYFEAYYPISPKIAIIIKNTINKFTIRTSKNNDEIISLNNLIYEKSLNQVYAKEYDNLQKFLKK